jgi:hypothetical protein
MIVLDKCWTDEEGDVVDYKTLEHEVLDSFETEEEAHKFIAALKNGSDRATEEANDNASVLG